MTASKRPASGAAKTPAQQKAVRAANAASPQPVANGGFRARVRMYRHGLGDCFLVTLPRAAKAKEKREHFILIDCGLILGTPDAANKMGEVVQDINQSTGGAVDLLLVTHEHWDHVSGFIQAADEFAKLKIGQVWMAWTEDPDDELANKLRAKRDQALQALRLSANQMLLAGEMSAAREVSGLLEFFGASAGSSTKDALEAVRKLTAKPLYCRPGEAPVEPDVLEGIRLYVLGPPRDERLIKKTEASARGSETYGIMASTFSEDVQGGLNEDEEASQQLRPFDAPFLIPSPIAHEIDFFKARYWGGEEWRRIDAAWLGEAAGLALQLDSSTNNTSLVLAIELQDKDVLLFAGDAQVGNWESWQDLRWSIDGWTVTGPDLLNRTVFYKVGHHGSHNATLREKGLGEMTKLGAAMIPVDQATALKKGWDRMPLPALLDALSQKTGGNVFRSDEEPPAAAGGKLVTKDLYYELVL